MIQPQSIKLDHVYYITISAEKEAQMEKKLATLFPSQTTATSTCSEPQHQPKIYTKFQGVNGRELDLRNTYQSKMITQNGLALFNQRNRPFGSIGCYLSHIKLWEQIIQNHKPNEHILILEDDIDFVPKNPQQFSALWNEITSSRYLLPNWDMIYYDHNTIVGKRINKHYAVPFNGASIGCNAFLSCYLVKVSSLKKLIKVCTPIGKFPGILEIDVLMRNCFHLFNALFYIHHLAKQNKSLKSCRCSINWVYKQ